MSEVSGTELLPGDDGESLPAGEKVLRLGKQTPEFLKHGRPSRLAFTPTSEDKASANPRVSVYAERLTTPGQAQALSAKPDEYTVAFRLGVDAIRALRPDPDHAEVGGLDVQWEKALRQEAGTFVANSRPGASGHAGISGLHRPEGQNRSLMLRSV